MTVGGRSLTSRPLWTAGVVVGALALGFVVVSAAVGSRAQAGATLDCDTTEATYGDDVTCTITSSGSATVQWGDGTVEPAVAGSLTHAPGAVGPLTIAVVGDDGTVLAAHLLTIEPDLAIECDHGLPLPVYELAPAIGGVPQPYDYVYLAADGSKIRPGDADYPERLGEMLAMERSVVEEAPIVGLCRSASTAVDELGGSVTWTVESPWYEPYVTRSRNMTPGTPAHWDGVQPIDVSVTVDVDGYEASERVGVYFGGCG